MKSEKHPDDNTAAKQTGREQGQNNEKVGNNNDLPDSPRDKERLQSEEITLDLPEVKDIPGQEHIHVPPAGEMADTTISSADEEGEGLLDWENEEDDEIARGTEADVSSSEKRDLEDTANTLPTEDEVNLRRSALDKRDDEGEELNERSDRTGSELDVPGSELDDREESFGEEDEENNPYSLGSDDNDNLNEGTP